MKELTPRERLSLTILPIGILSILYFFFIGKDLSAETKELQRQLTTLQDRQPSAQQLSSTMEQLSALRREARARGLGDATQTQGQSATRQDGDRKREEGFLSESLSRARLMVLEERRVAGPESTRMPIPRTAGDESSVWHLSLLGTFEQMALFLRSLSELEGTDGSLPLSIGFASGHSNGNPVNQWELWIKR